MPPVIQLRGAALLKVVGIIMIIIGAIGIGSGVVSFFSGRMMASVFELDAFGIRYFQIVGAISMASGAVELVFGILGLRFRGRADKAGFLLVIGIIQILITVFSTLYSKMMASAGARVMEQMMDSIARDYGTSAAISPNMYESLSGNIGLMVINFILPVLFVIGALLNRLPPKMPYMPPQNQGGI